MTSAEIAAGATGEAAMRTCRTCQAVFVPTDRQKRLREWICRKCAYQREKKWKERRAAEGRPVPNKWHSLDNYRKWSSEYATRPEVLTRRRDRDKRRHLDPDERMKATVRSITRNAISSGKLVRQPCEVCGVEPAQAHHDDYSKPLDVRWLCTVHHAEHHAKARREANGPA